MNHTFKGTPPTCSRCGEHPNRDRDTECINRQDCDDAKEVFAKIHGMLTQAHNEVPATVALELRWAQSHLEAAIHDMETLKTTKTK